MNTDKKILIPALFIVFALIITVFYWLVIRPSVIKKECYKRTDKTGYMDLPINQDQKDQIYSDCLREKGY